MIQNLVIIDAQTSGFCASTIAASELTSNKKTRTSFTFLGPSQNLVDSTFKTMQSTRSAASRRSSVRNLCMPPCAHVELITPIGHTKEDWVLPCWFNSCHILRDRKDHEEDVLQNATVIARTCAPCAAHSCLAGSCTCHKPERRDWMSSWELPSEAPDETSQICSHSMFHKLHCNAAQCPARREPLPDTSFLKSAIAYSSAPFVWLRQSRVTIALANQNRSSSVPAADSLVR